MTRGMRRRSMVLAAGALALLLVVAGCSGSDEDTTAAQDTSPQAAAQPTQAAAMEDKGPELTADQKAVMALPGYKQEWGTPQYGGVLLHGQPDIGGTGGANDDPQLTRLYNRHTTNRWDQLIRIDPWGDVSTIEGDLAKSWEVSDNGLTLTFQLHEGVKFHDGSAFDCADVVASMDRYLDPPGAINTVAKSLLNHVTDVSCADPSTVVMKMNEVRGSTAASLANGTVFMLSEEMIAKLNELGDAVTGRSGLQTPITEQYPLLMSGTGPFIFDSWQAGVNVTLKKNPNYFKEGLPLLDGIQDVIMRDSTARFAALTAGKIHQAGEGSASLLPAQVQQVRSRFKDKVVLSWTGSPGQQGFSYNQTKPPFDDARVRKALDLVLDRQAWMKIQGANEDLMFGNARISGIQAWGTQWALDDAELLTFPGYRQPKTQDIEEARRLLEEAGYENGFEASCMTRTSQNYMDVCLFGIEQWRTTLGLDISSRFLEGAAASSASRECNYDMSITWSSGTSSVQDPDWTLWRAFNSDANGAGAPCERTFPGTEYQATIDKQLVDILHTLDPVKKKQLSQDVERSLLLDAIPYSGIGWTMYNYGNAPEVRGANWYNYGTYIYHVMPERMWLSDDGERWWEGFYQDYIG